MLQTTDPLIGINKEQALEIISQMSQQEIMSQISSEDALLWIYNHVGTETGKKLSFERRPYLAPILRDFSPHIVYKKSAQVGITMCGGIAKCLYAADVLGLTAIYTFPTAKDVNDFAKARFRYIIRNSKYLHSRIGDVDSNSLVRMGNATIYFRGTWAQRQAISVPSMLNVHDELDFSSPDVREVYSSRLDAAEFYYGGELQRGWEWDFSTPTIPKFGVSALYEQSDQHEWRIKCTGCGRRQRVNFFKNLRHKGRGRKKNYYFGCLKCDKELDRTTGWWEAKYPENPIRGYHITQQMCAFIDPNKMVATYEQSKASSEKLRKFHNFNLGLEYEDSSEVITRSLVLNRVTEGTTEQGNIFIGVDQGSLLHVVVSKFTNGKRRYIWIGTLDSFPELANLIEHYNPKACVIDGLPNTHNARDLSTRFNNVFCAYYGGSKKLNRYAWARDLEKKEVKIPRTELLDNAAYHWNIGDVVVENYIPTAMIEEFADQMSNSKRMLQETNTGEKKAIWVKVGDDHFRHADAYNWIASEIGTIAYNNTLSVSEEDPLLYVGENLFKEEEIW